MLNSERENMGLNPEGLKIMGFYKGFLAEDILKNKGFWTLNDLEKTLIEEVECTAFWRLICCYVCQMKYIEKLTN